MERRSQIDHYEILRTLGAGEFAKVKLALDTTDNMKVALKIMKVERKYKGDPSTIQKLRKRFLPSLQSEIQAISRITHPNIVHIYHVSEDSVYHSKGQRSFHVAYFAMELLPNGELFDVLYYTGPLEEHLARVYFRQLIDAVDACHSQGISHRDLKPENILFDADFNLKLADFGFAIATSGRDGTGQLHTNLGTYEYMAPEMLRHESYSGVSVDLYACGLILFILVTGHPVCSRAEQSDQYYSLFLNDNEKFWLQHSNSRVGFSPDFKDLINSMLAENPGNRLSLQAIRAHPWVTSPSLSVKQARARMRTLHSTTQQKKLAEEEAKKAQRLTVVARGGQYRSDLADSSCSDSSESSSGCSPYLKRLLPFVSGTEKFSRMFTVLCPERVMMRLTTILRNLQAEIQSESQSKFKLIAKVQADLRFSVELFDVGNGTICLDLTKLEGSGYGFMEMFDSLSQLFLKVPEG